MSTPFADVPGPTLVAVEDPAPAAPADVAEELTPDIPAADAEPEGWQHQTVEFKGDTLEVRKPTQKALAAFSLATSRYVPNNTRNDMTALFLMTHMSPESFSRVFTRLMDEDDLEYTLNTVGELMTEVVALTGGNPAG